MATQKARDLQLRDLALQSYRLCLLIGALVPETTSVLEAVGWGKEDRSQLNAELVRVADCAHEATIEGGAFET